MKFKVGDRVVFKRYGLFMQPGVYDLSKGRISFNKGQKGIIEKIVENRVRVIWATTDGIKNSISLSNNTEYLELDKQWYRQQKINTFNEIQSW